MQVALLPFVGPDRLPGVPEALRWRSRRSGPVRPPLTTARAIDRKPPSHPGVVRAVGHRRRLLGGWLGAYQGRRPDGARTSAALPCPFALRCGTSAAARCRASGLPQSQPVGAMVPGASGSAGAGAIKWLLYVRRVGGEVNGRCKSVSRLRRSRVQVPPSPPVIRTASSDGGRLSLVPRKHEHRRSVGCSSPALIAAAAVIACNRCEIMARDCRG